MSTMTARLQAMIATLDDMLEDDRVWQYPMTPSAIDECRQAMDQIRAASPEPKSQPMTSCDCGDYCAWCRPEMFTSTAVRVTVDSGWKYCDIREWVEAFFSHPERIQIKRFEVKR